MPQGKQKRPDVKRSVRRARRRRAWIVGWVAGAVVVVLVGYFAYQASPGQPGVKMPDQGNLHIATETTPHVPYNSDPPTSGPHLPHKAPWGIHTTPISKELQVHNLEDGGVMVQYSCDCPAEVEKLKAIVKAYDRDVVLAPYPGMKTRFALTAWTRIEQFDDIDEKRVKRFIDAYRGIDHHK
jgi:hypothetical protein